MVFFEACSVYTFTSKSWLLPLTPSSLVELPNFVLLRKDTEDISHKHGVCVYLKFTLGYYEVNTKVPNTLAVYLPDFNLCLNCLPTSFKLFT